MKKLITLFALAVFTIGLYAQPGISTFKYEIRAPAIRIGGATKVKLDSIVQNVDTIKFYTGGTELKSNGSGIWTGSGIRLDTTLARVTLGIDQVTNESKATMFNLPLFTGTSTFSGSIIPNTSATWYFGSNDNRWNGIYFSNTAFMNWGNNISISGISDRLEFISGNLDLNDNNLYSTGDIGTSLSRVNNLYVDSLFSNYSDITLTGYAPLNNPTFTGTVTMPDINLPNGTSAFLDGNINSYITFNEFQIDMNAHVNLGDNDLFANYIGGEDNRVEGGYFGFVAADTMITQSIGVADTAVSYGFFDNLNINNRPTVGIATVATTDDINDSIAEYLNNATIGVAAADSNAYGGYTTRTYVESLLGDGAGLVAQRLPFIVDVTAGAPSEADTLVIHSAIAGKHVDVYRDGAKQYQNFTTTNTVEGFRVSGDTIFVNPAWQANEQVLVDIIQPVMWSYLAFTDTGSLSDSLLSYWKMDEASGNLVDALGYKNLTISGAPTPQQTGKINYCWSYDGVDDFHQATDTLYLNHRDKFTASAWVRTATATSDGAIMGAIDGAGNGSGWYISCSSTQTQISFFDGSLSYVRTAATDITDQAWHHVAVTYNGATAQLYVDGSPAGAALTADVAYAQYAFFRINRSNGEYLDASIDNAAYWHKCLDSDEISDLYAAENGGLEYPWNQ